MTSAPLHPALGPAGERPLPHGARTDQERLAVLLQAAALLWHLDRAGWALADGWRGAALDAEGRLTGLTARPGASRTEPQELLRALLVILFGDPVAGRGEARRVARGAAERWRQALAPVALAEEVSRLLAEAPFLATPRFAAAREALAAARGADGPAKGELAAPQRVRRRWLAAGRTLESLRERLRSERFIELWEEEAPAAESPGSESALARARERFDQGQFLRALAVLRDHDETEAELLRAACERQLGQFAAAAETLSRLAPRRLTPAQAVAALDLATAVYANLSEPKMVDRWLERVRPPAGSSLAVRRALAAAEAAGDRSDLEAMDRHLEAARPLLDRPETAWLWHRAAGQRAILADEPAAAIRALAAALRSGRRHQRLFEAGRIWNQVGVARMQADDYPGAERALGHSVRLLQRCEGPLAHTLALCNLAETRLRRGRLLGVEQIVTFSAAENERQGNLRGWAQDQELWARLELVRGRPEAALARCLGARERIEAAGSDLRLADLALLEARALGWLGRGDEAAAALARTTPAARAELDREERPAIWALAGVRDEAWRAAATGPYAALWRPLLDGTPPPPAAWTPLHRLEPYRAARLVLDCELLVPGVAPAGWQQAARAALHRVGAHRLAERIGSAETGLWRAVERYAASPVRGNEALAELFAELGEPSLRLTWEGPDDGMVTVVPGPGGGEEYVAPCGEGTLRLAAAHLPAPARALFALAMRDYQPPAPASATPSARLIGRSPAMRAAVARLQRLAPTGMPVLLLGESGTGKELAARELHLGSPRHAGPFLPVNCAGLTETLIHSELFGHARGAFTGADRDRMGVFESARGGTLFLDEIGDLPLGVQGSLLRVLQEHEVRRLGESLPRKVDVRLVAATHRDLAAMVRGGTFREDLFFRLKVARVELPPLRERGDDVLLLAEALLARIAGADPVPRLAPEARGRLRSHRWPGNVRELENVLRFAAVLAEGGVIRAADLDLEGPEEEAAPRDAGEYHRRIEEYRRELLVAAMRAHDGRQAAAARWLGISRQTLSYLLRRFDLEGPW